MRTVVASIVSILLLVYFICVRIRSSRTEANLPPSPKPLPVVGNINSLPPTGQLAHLHWLKLEDTCGPISSVNVLGTTIIVLHDPQAALDLLEKQSLKTAGRPTLTFAGELCGYGKLLTFCQYDSTYRWHRKLIHQQLGSKVAASQFREVQDVESRRFLLRVLSKPNDLMTHIKTEASAIILKMTYGYSIEPQSEEPLVQLIERMMENINIAAAPMTWAVDILPPLKYLPSWFPGTQFLGTARQIRRVNQMALNTPFSFVQRQMDASETYCRSYLSSHLEQQTRDRNGKITLSTEEEDALKLTAGAMYGGAADTTFATLSSFVLAMILFPEVQRKAQMEIDRVIGNVRLPNFGDQDKLPYLGALVKEALRWMPVAPMGIGHMATEALTYVGFSIPKGALILPAIWWFFHDPEMYPDPEVFKPERFLPPQNAPDPTSHAFGYGRRVCPGKYLATDNTYITIARILAVFDISRGVDDKGAEIEPRVEPSVGPLSHPLPFAYRIRPRSEIHAELVRASEQEFPWEKGDSNELDTKAIKELLSNTL